MKKDPLHSTGFDAHGVSRDDDTLSRWRFAERVYELVRSTPRTWSVRIGIYGSWGSGKSTVLAYVSDLAKSHGDIPIPFNPWGFETRETMFAALFREINRVAAEHGVAVPALQRAHALVAQWSAHLGLAADLIAVAHENAGKAATGLFGLFSKKVGPDVKRLTTAIPLVAPDGSTGPRVVFLIDDLDRSSPAAVPALLFALKELFDETTFAFVLAIDPRRLAEIISATHGVADGIAFLEKIIEFPRWLPAPTPNGLAAIARRDLERWCPSLAGAPLDAVAEYLPSNPRLVRLIVRQLITARGELARFADDEIDQVAFMLVSILRVQWPSALSALAARAKTLITEFGMVHMGFSRVAEAHRSQLEKSLSELLSEAALDPSAIAPARAVVEALCRRLMMKPRDVLPILIKLELDPVPMTAKEFRESVLPTTEAATLVVALEQLGRARSTAAHELVPACVRLASAELGNALTTTTHASTDPEVSGALVVANAVTRLLRLLVDNPQLRAGLDEAAIYAVIRVPGVVPQASEDVDASVLGDLRSKAKTIATTAISSADFPVISVLKTMYQEEQRRSRQDPSEDQWPQERLTLLEARGRAFVLDCIRTQEGIQRQQEQAGDWFEHFLTRSFTTPAAHWLDALRALVVEAAHNSKVQENFIRLFEIVAEQLRRGDRSPAIAHEAAQVLWAGASAEALRGPTQWVLRDARIAMINALPQISLPTPEWWPTQSPPGGSDGITPPDDFEE